MTALATATRTAVIVLAAARVTRLITTDKITEHVVIGRLRRRALAAERREAWQRIADVATAADEEVTVDQVDRMVEAAVTEETMAAEPHTHLGILMEGLDCPFCTGWWVTAALVAGEVVIEVAPLPRPVKVAWRALTAALAASYVVGHLSSRLDG